MATKQTYQGPRYRVQLQVFDFNDSPVAQWRGQPPTFVVCRCWDCERAKLEQDSGRIAGAGAWMED